MNFVLDQLFKRKKLIIILFTFLLGYGIYSYITIPKQDMPAINTPYMLLSIEAPSLSARDIEENAISDIEELISTFSDVIDVRSTIYDNFAIIITTFSFQTDDPTLLSSEIYEKINDLTLPEGITSIKYESNFDDPHIIFSLYSESLNETELLEYSSQFKNELLLVNEVKDVEIHSSYNREVSINLSLDLLDTYQLTILDIYQILYSKTTNLPLGYIESFGISIPVDGTITFETIEQLEEIVIIPKTELLPTDILLSDIANIEYIDTQEKEFYFNNKSANFISVYFDDDIDFTKMGDEIINVKNKFISDNDDNGFYIGEMLFLPDYVDDQISNVFSSLLIAIGIVMVVVLFGIGFRNSLLIVITIPIIVFATIAILNAFDMELHKLSIVGLIVSIGILVDNQIVITEGIKRNIEKGLKSDLSSKVSIKENIWPVLSSSLTTIAAFLVIAILPGFLGEIVRSMPLTVIITISLSFIVSMSLSPVLATVFLRISKKKKSKSVHEQRIKSMISFTIKFPKIWILISVVLFAVSSYFAFTTLDIDLYPNDERSILYIDFEGDINNQESTTLIHDEIIEELNTNSDVLNYSSSIGGDLPNFHFSSKLINEQPHIGRIYVNLDYNEKELLDYADELELDLKEINNRITVNTIELSPPIPPMRVIVSNKDKEVLSTESNLLYSELNDLDYVKTISIQESVIAPKFIINYDIDEMNSSFISKIEVDSIIAANLNGLDLSFFSYNNNHIVVNIDTDIVSMNDILELPITSSTTSISYTLDDFVSISSVDDYALITRQNGIPISIIDVYPDGIDNFELEDNIEKLRQTNNLNKSTFDYSGENQMFEEISTDLIRASIIALVLIFIIMFIQFNNFVKPLIVYLTIPLSFTGSFLFLLAFNQAITATSLIGMVSLIGVTVNTGILLVEYISREFEKTNDLKQACINSVYLRFRPIMLTSVTTILGLIPLLITGGNFFRPLAITFMGGLVTSTIITIFLVPSFYYMIYKNKKTS